MKRRKFFIVLCVFLVCCSELVIGMILGVKAAWMMGRAEISPSVLLLIIIVVWLLWFLTIPFFLAMGGSLISQLRDEKEVRA